MSKNHEDQAAGLRRLMTSPKPRVLSIVSVAQTRQSRLMTNLAASICVDGNEVLIVQASTDAPLANIALKAPLVDFINTPLLNNQIDSDKMSVTSAEGYAIAALLHPHQALSLDDNTSQQLNTLFTKLAMQFQIVLVEASLSPEQKLPLKILNESQIVIQLTSQPEDIKQAYQLIKQITFQHIAANIKSQTLGILVTESSQAQAQLVYNNIAQVAKRFLKLELEFIGVIPQDESLTKADKLGRSVIEVFPMAKATAAFKSIAHKLASQLYGRNSLPALASSTLAFEVGL